MTVAGGADASNAGLRRSFSASLDQVELFIADIHGFLAERNLSGLSFDMELLAREALVNAVLHGSGGDPDRMVHAALTLEPGGLVLLVRDEGPGWNWRAHAPAAPAPDSESGRGLFIIRKYSDEFYYNDPGNALTIVKRVPSEAKPMDHSQKHEEVRLDLDARLTAQDVPALRESYRERILQGARAMVLDCSRLESIDSMGIGLLVATHNSLAKLGGRLALVGVRREIVQLLTLMRLDKHISITPAEA